VELTGPGKVISQGSGRSAARLARLLREQEVGSSNLPAPTTKLFKGKRLHLLVCLFSFLVLAQFHVKPAVAGSPASYQVVRGDNLSVIAARFGVTVKELKQANNLKSDVIHVGQNLQIKKPLHLTRDRDVRWARPIRKPGPVIKPFGPYKVKGVIMPQTGVDVACAWGTSVISPANGVVRHVGHMEGFGTLMIIEHGGGFSTVLAPFDPASIKVKAGQAISRGAPLGRTGNPAPDSPEPYLHLELRKNDKSVKPDRLLK
jgi:murein DD-endopeptidase MepM/ murein hydrolase activator NlpD